MKYRNVDEIAHTVTREVTYIIDELNKLVKQHVKQSTWHLLDLAVSLRSCPLLKHAVEELVMEISKSNIDEETKVKIYEMCRMLLKLLCFNTCLPALDFTGQTAP